MSNFQTNIWEGILKGGGISLQAESSDIVDMDDFMFVRRECVRTEADGEYFVMSPMVSIFQKKKKKIECQYNILLIINIFGIFLFQFFKLFFTYKPNGHLSAFGKWF